MEINIQIDRKHTYMILFVLVLGFASILVFSQGSPTQGHPAGEITSGTFAGGGDYIFPAGSKVGIGEINPKTQLDVDGAVKVGSQDTCDASAEGAIRYNSGSKEIEFCDGSGWKRIDDSAGSYTARLSDNIFQGDHNCDSNPGSCCDSGEHMCTIVELQEAINMNKVPYSSYGHGWIEGFGFMGGSYSCSGWSDNNVMSTGSRATAVPIRYRDPAIPEQMGISKTISTLQDSCLHSNKVWCCKN